jgi:nucleoside phosphorylase
VILAGLAGALDPKMKSGSAHVITAVMDDEGRPAPCSHLAEVGLSAQAACVIVSASTSVTSPQEKHALFQRTGANLVDLESQAFMTFAQQAGWRWLIIRGVSDGAEESLPRNIDQWVDQRGRNCAGTIARSIILNPALLLRLPRLRRSGLQAMSQVAEMIHKLHGHSAKHCRGLSV